jgi:hypothetical protein
MNMAEIKEEVARIDAMKGDDDESAHSAEDVLRENFIAYIAENGPAELAEMAREILKTRDIDFARWCA